MVNFMPTKGPCFLYGNTNGSPTIHINFPYAIDFNNKKLSIHLKKHGKQFNAISELDYKTKAINFANKVDRENCISFVDNFGSTHKFNTKTLEYVIVDKNQIIVTYFKTPNWNNFINNINKDNKLYDYSKDRLLNEFKEKFYEKKS